MLAGRQHFVSVGNRLKRHCLGGKSLLSGYITDSSRNRLVLSEQPVQIQRDAIKNYSVYPIISSALANVKKLHDKISRIDLSVYPSVIYSLAYQDRVIHAFERFLQNYHTGEYNGPDVIGRLGREYEKNRI